MNENTNHCPNCECERCVSYFENKREHEVRENTFKQWNWDMSPAEVAREMESLQNTDPAWYDPEDVLEHLEQFFDKNTAEAVRDCYETFCC